MSGAAAKVAFGEDETCENGRYSNRRNNFQSADHICTIKRGGGGRYHA